MNDDPELEAQWYDEFANACESVAIEYRRAAALLRFAGRALPEDELADFRLQLAGIADRTIRATAIAASLVVGKGSSVKP